MRGYMLEAGKRGPGFLVQALATIILFFGALIGAVATLFGHPLPNTWF
jgi:hypothetical protein